MPAATEREQTEESIIRTMAMNGHPLRIIAKTLGRPPTYVWHRLRALGVTAKKAEAAITIQLSMPVMESLGAAAARRGMKDAELAGEILSAVIQRGSVAKTISRG